MEINHLRVIRELVADPNLTRAADRLHLTQSALSKRVQAIEDELGTQLFERRGPKGLKPLPQAFEFSQLADRLLSAWDTGLRKVQTVAIEPEQFVLIGPPLFLREVVLPWWNKQSKDFPLLQLEVRCSSLSQVSLETIKAGADAAILEHKEELSDYVCKPLYSEQWGIVRHPQVKQQDLKKYIWGTVATHDNPVDTWLVRRQRMAPPIYRVYWQDLTALAIWVSENPGAATVLPWHSVAWLVQRGRLAYEPLGKDSVSYLYLAYQKSTPHKRLMKELTQIGETAAMPPVG